MPQLPSGLHFALDPAPLIKLIDASRQATRVHELMAVEHIGDLFQHVDILYFHPSTDISIDPKYADSNRPPSGLESYSSGYNLLSIREVFKTWCAEDQQAFEEFLNQPRVSDLLDALLDEVGQTKQALLAQPATLPGLLATYWRAGCHPLQEELHDLGDVPPDDRP
jgi:hypothetical protein